jgi:hypothetical protein
MRMTVQRGNWYLNLKNASKNLPLNLKFKKEAIPQVVLKECLMALEEGDLGS